MNWDFADSKSRSADPGDQHDKCTPRRLDPAGKPDPDISGQWDEVGNKSWCWYRPDQPDIASRSCTPDQPDSAGKSGFGRKDPSDEACNTAPSLHRSDRSGVEHRKYRLDHWDSGRRSYKSDRWGSAGRNQSTRPEPRSNLW